MCLNLDTAGLAEAAVSNWSNSVASKLENKAEKSMSKRRTSAHKPIETETSAEDVFTQDVTQNTDVALGGEVMLFSTEHATQTGDVWPADLSNPLEFAVYTNVYTHNGGSQNDHIEGNVAIGTLDNTKSPLEMREGMSYIGDLTTESLGTQSHNSSTFMYFPNTNSDGTRNTVSDWIEGHGYEMARVDQDGKTVRSFSCGNKMVAYEYKNDTKDIIKDEIKEWGKKSEALYALEEQDNDNIIVKNIYIKDIDWEFCPKIVEEARLNNKTVVLNILDDGEVDFDKYMDAPDGGTSYQSWASRIIWNFGRAKSVTTRAIFGVILVPNSTFTNKGNVVGAVIADKFHQTEEVHQVEHFHHEAFPEPTETPTPDSTETPAPTDSTETPEPTATVTPAPTATPEPTATVTPEPTAEPTATPTAEPTATPTAEPTETPIPTATPGNGGTPAATPTTTPAPTATETPEPAETPKPTETPAMYLVRHRYYTNYTINSVTKKQIHDGDKYELVTDAHIGQIIDVEKVPVHKTFNDNNYVYYRTKTDPFEFLVIGEDNAANVITMYYYRSVEFTDPTDEPTTDPTPTPVIVDNTPAPTATPEAESTATPSVSPTATPEAESTATPAVMPTATPTAEPTPEPTEEPTATPTEEPTPEPTEEPTATPTEEPTPEPTEEPTAKPTATPTLEPTATPTAKPTATPTLEPTATPTAGSPCNNIPYWVVHIYKTNIVDAEGNIVSTKEDGKVWNTTSYYGKKGQVITADEFAQKPVYGEKTYKFINVSSNSIKLVGRSEGITHNTIYFYYEFDETTPTTTPVEPSATPTVTPAAPTEAPADNKTPFWVMHVYTTNFVDAEGNVESREDGKAWNKTTYYGNVGDVISSYDFAQRPVYGEKTYNFKKAESDSITLVGRPEKVTNNVIILYYEIDENVPIIPTAPPTETPTVPTAVPTETPVEPSETPAAPTETPVEPSETPAAPTETPVEPSATPDAAPTATPDAAPTATPTAEPATTPTAEPTPEPTVTPDIVPTEEPDNGETPAPTVTPTTAPTVTPDPVKKIRVTWLDGYSEEPEDVIKIIKISKGDDYTEEYPEDPTRPDHIFTGWGEPEEDEEGNITITAQWKPIPKPTETPELTVPTDTPNPSEPTGTPEPSDPSDPTTPTATPEPSDPTDPIPTETPDNSKKITVTWLDGHSEDPDDPLIKQERIDKGDDYSKDYPNDPTRSGHTFTGWGDPEEDEDGNITITAQWEPIPEATETPAPTRRPSGGNGSAVSGGGGGNSGGKTRTPNNNNDIPEIDIEENDVPLAGAPGLNSEDHIAYIRGYEDGTVRPLGDITRAEIATIFFRLMTDDMREANLSSINSFTDVSADDWFNNAISTDANAGLLKGREDGSFDPNASITRAEFASVAARFLSDDVEVADSFEDIKGHWAEHEINRAVKAGWIRGRDSKTFAPDEKITRAEVMTIVNRMLDRVGDSAEMLDTMVKWPDNPQTEWYYSDVQEATNSHDYGRDEMGITETWTEMVELPHFSVLEDHYLGK